MQRNATFRRRVLVTPQQTPGGAAAWQDRGHATRGTLVVEVQVRMAWCRFSCSRSVSPWQRSSVAGGAGGEARGQRSAGSEVGGAPVLPVLQVGPVKPGSQWQTGTPDSEVRHSPWAQLQAGRSQDGPW